MVADILKVSVKGTLPGGEVWSVNPVFKMFVTRAISDEEMAALVQAAVAVNVPSGLASKWSPSTAMTGVRIEARRLTGELDRVGEGNKTSPVVGTGSGALPYQSSGVVTLVTQIASGYARGRVYWPLTGVVLNASTLRMSSSDALGLAQSTDTYFTSLQVALEGALGGQDMNLCVWSRTRGVGYVVYSLRSGDVVDTQRRRRDSLKETYQVIDYQGS